MSDPFEYHTPGLDAPALGSIAITPSDTTDLASRVRTVTIGGTAGTIRYISAKNGETCNTATLPVGMHPIWASRILETGTTATELTGWI